MKPWQIIAGGLVLIFGIIQLIPNELPPAAAQPREDLLNNELVNTEVAQLLKTSCYDCHSNETNYPWYSHIAPVSWLVARDVREGREELNFSKWQEYDLNKMLGKLEDISEEVSEEKMPMKIYTLIHPSANLDVTQRELIIAWAESTMDKIAEEEVEGEEEVEEDSEIE